jgi:hypothetical protein
MKKTSSIIEEALIEASQLEEAVKEVGKEVLATAMKQEIDEIIKSSLTEEEEEESPEMDSMGMETPEMPEAPESTEAPEMPEMEDGEEDEEEVMDMTQSTDEEVIKVFKAMGPEDSIEVTKTEDGIHLKDGDNEYILQMEGVQEMTDEELDEYLDEATFEDFDELDIEDEDEDEDDDEEEYEEDENVEDDDLEFEGWMNELMDEESMDKFMSSENPDTEDASADDMDEEYGEVVYEIELDEDSEEEDESVMDEDMEEDDEDEDLEEAARTYGNGSRDGSRGLRKGITPNRYISYKNGFDIKVESENKQLKNQIKLIESELKEYKAKNNEYKSALGSLKEKMNEMAVYYTNLSYTNKLFTEHTTTKKEKLDILKKFDNVKTVNESKNLFKMLSEDLSSKKTISNLNSLSENVEKTLTSSSSKLTESVVYEDPKIKQIKDLMSKLNRK